MSRDDSFDFGDIEREVVEHLVDQLREALRDVTCPVHGRTPTVQVKSTGRDAVDFEVEACCRKLRKIVDQAIHDLQ